MLSGNGHCNGARLGNLVNRSGECCIFKGQIGAIQTLIKTKHLTSCSILSMFALCTLHFPVQVSFERHYSCLLLLYSTFLPLTLWRHCALKGLLSADRPFPLRKKEKMLPRIWSGRTKWRNSCCGSAGGDGTGGARFHALPPSRDGRPRL